jgi:alanine dehydrogenase
MAKWVSESDIVITTALIPGRPAPKLISATMLEGMKPGSGTRTIHTVSTVCAAPPSPGYTVDPVYRDYRIYRVYRVYRV